ncbi:MAG: cytochrome c oxidase accessory protein CcoG [Verrucomicrobiota bacterium]
MPKIEQPTREQPASPSGAQDIDWKDYRDHLATADKTGKRLWLFPRQPSGRFYRARTWFTWILLAVMFGGPFVRIQGEPLLLMNIVDRKFVILGQVFWPQDGVILAVGLLVFFMGIAIFTAAFGRLWCGWTCPQTVMMEMVFRKIEYFIEGDAQAQRALAAAPWTAGKLLKKVGKQAIFFVLSFIIGNTLLAYIIGTEALFQIITDDPSKHVTGLGFMLAFTGVFYAIFARFREQACTFICPYGRFQSALLDENSIVVAYDHKRGESRGQLKRAQTLDQRAAAGRGDCVDCFQCVTVCPTGIDIRNGTQMECVNCTACIDACDSVMTKIGRPRGLIRYASLNGIENRQKLKFTLRLKVYSFILLALIGLECFLLFSRSDVETTLLRAPGAMFQKMPDGRYSNLYTVKVVNKTGREMPIQFKLENLTGTVQVMGQDIVVAPRQLAETSVLVDLDQAVMKSGSTPLVIGVYSNGRKIETVKTAFIGPRHDD